MKIQLKKLNQPEQLLRGSRKLIVKDAKLKVLFISILLVLFSTHIVQVIINGISLNQVTLPLILLASLAIYNESRKMYGISFLLMGILITLTIPTIGNLTPFIFFFLSIYYEKNNKVRIVIPSILISSFVISYHLNGFNNYINLIEGIFGNLALLALFYFLFIRQPSKIDHLSKVTPLSCRQLLILKYLALDIPRKQIVDKVSEKELWKYDIDNFTLDIINSEIAKIKKTLEIDSEFSLGIWYNKKTEIPE